MTLTTTLHDGMLCSVLPEYLNIDNSEAVESMTAGQILDGTVLDGQVQKYTRNEIVEIRNFKVVRELSKIYRAFSIHKNICVPILLYILEILSTRTQRGSIN
jgi:hypothetical protein